jgi:hypothetical protein
VRQNDDSHNTFNIIAGIILGYLVVGLIFVFIQSVRCGGSLFATDTNKYLSAFNIMLTWPIYFLRMGIHWACRGYS